MPKDVTFLIVEDDEVDVMGLERAFKTLRIANEWHVARDGIQALEFLRGQGGRKKIKSPYIILLDLNMPRMSGFELLQVIRDDPALKHSVVFVLTTSNDDKDRVAAYEKNVAGYIVKSDPTAGFLEAISMLKTYWRYIQIPETA